MDTPWTILCFSGVDWDSHKQRPQRLMSAFAERGHPILYVDNLGTRLPRPRDFRRVTRRFGNWLRSSSDPRRPGRARIRVDSPIVVPLQHLRIVRKLDSSFLYRRLRKRLGTKGPLVVWTYLPMPTIVDVAAALHADALVYDWADDASAHVLTPSGRHRRRIARWEEEMLTRSDLVFVASKELLRRRGSPNPNTHVMPHGTSTSGARRLTPPPEVARLPRPRIGFVGSISDSIDIDLIDRIARARPQWSFVLVGPLKTKVGRLKGRANILLTGELSQEEIPGLLDSFDSAIIPYRLSPAIEVASPVKLREYLAHGLPVVSVDIPEVRRFAPPVRLAAGPDGFVDALEQALRDGRSKRSGTSLRSWRAAANEMARLIDERLLGSRAAEISEHGHA